MNRPQHQMDLMVLTADRQAEHLMRALLPRSQSLGIRPVQASFAAHPDRDAGCLLHAHEFLLPFSAMYSHAIVMLDREGCGRESRDRLALEAGIEKLLRSSGWGDRAAAIVLDPELEIWIWTPSRQVDEAVGWAGRQPDLRTWLRQQGLLKEGATKPSRPKEALEAALMHVGKVRMGPLYGQVAYRTSTAGCVDASFAKLKELLQKWFPPATSQGDQRPTGP